MSTFISVPLAELEIGKFYYDSDCESFQTKLEFVGNHPSTQTPLFKLIKKGACNYKADSSDFIPLENEGIMFEKLN